MNRWALIRTECPILSQHRVGGSGSKSLHVHCECPPCSQRHCGSCPVQGDGDGDEEVEGWGGDGKGGVKRIGDCIAQASAYLHKKISSSDEF